MDVELSKVEFQEDYKRIFVTVTYTEEVGEVNHSARVGVFIDWTDSYAEIKPLALEKARAFLLLAASDR